MKKVLHSVLTLLFVATGLLLASCTKTPEVDFWTPTHTLSMEFKQNPTNKFLFDKDAPLTWTAVLNEQINDENNTEYNQLKTQYYEILLNSVFMFDIFSSNLKIQPTTSEKNAKGIFSNFNKQLNNFQSEIDTFGK